jgi:tetratricopeptide (TPR) repeat protein
MTATDIVSNKVSSWNRQTYQRLKLALSLGLRRQIFVAVCDDLSLRNRLAGTLQAELGATSAKVSLNAQGAPKLVSLKLNLYDPNPLGQMAQWLVQNRQPRSLVTAPAFQILGVEGLTRRSPTVQHLFLRRLQVIDRYLPRMESTLLLWLPRPWFYTIQQSVPEFWQWHTGMFEFEGEPTPLPPVGASKPEASYQIPVSEGRTSSLPKLSYPKLASGEETGSFKEDLQRLLAHDLVDDVDLVSIGESIQESQQPTSDSDAQQQKAGSEAVTDKTNDKSLPAPKPTSNSDAQQQKAGSEAVTDKTNDKSLPAPNQEQEIHVDDREAQNPSSSSGESTEESNVASSNVQASTDKEQQSQSIASPVETYLQLGNYYRQAIEQGDASEENLAIAIQAYEQALQFLDPDASQAPDILNDIGNLYWMLSRCPTSAEHTLSYLEQSIQSYQLALTKLAVEDAPQTYGMIHNNLGAAYGDLARYQDPTDNLEQSIRAYQEALQYRRADIDPMKYASTQNNLGTAYWHLAQQQSSVPNLRAAIAAYNEALGYYTPESDPLNWAMIQNNMGTAYWNLAQYEQPETWLPCATAAYLEALKYRTAEVAPAACAATQNNLGTAYWHLADRFQDDLERKGDYLHRCIVAYECAIGLVQELAQKTPPVPVNFDVFATHNNLGLAHYQLATEPQFSLPQESKFTHLEAALEQHVKACLGVAAESEAYQNALIYIVRTIRTFYESGGIDGQNRALSKVPGQFLPEILPRL